MNSSRPLLTILATILSLGIVASTAAPPNYIVTKLGSLGDDFGLTVPFAINNGGRVVGQSNLDNTPHAFLSFHGMMEDLGTLGGSSAVANDINSSGVIVGVSEDSSGHFRPFRYRRGYMQDIGTLGGTHGAAYGINNRGEIVGQASASGDAAGRAFLFKGGTMWDLGTLGGQFSIAGDINESGTIVGSAALPDGLSHAFVYEAGVMHDLGTLGGELSYASSINNRGVVVGFAQLPDGRKRAVVFEHDRIHDLGSLGGRESFAEAINDQGIIVGNSTTLDPRQQQHAFVYTDGVMYDLHDFIVAAEPDADAIRSSFAHAINARGQIAVQAAVQFPGAVVSVRGYVLSPRHGGGWKKQ